VAVEISRGERTFGKLFGGCKQFSYDVDHNKLTNIYGFHKIRIYINT
jgi:hypothetical protein